MLLLLALLGCDATASPAPPGGALPAPSGPPADAAPSTGAPSSAPTGAAPPEAPAEPSPPRRGPPPEALTSGDPLDYLNVRVLIGWFVVSDLRDAPEAAFAAMRTDVALDDVPRELEWGVSGGWTWAFQSTSKHASLKWARAASRRGGPALGLWSGDGWWGWCLYEQGNFVGGAMAKAEPETVHWMGDLERAGSLLGVSASELRGATVPSADNDATTEFAKLVGVDVGEKTGVYALFELPAAHPASPAVEPFVGAQLVVLDAPYGLLTVTGGEETQWGPVWIAQTKRQGTARLPKSSTRMRLLVAPEVAERLLARALGEPVRLELPWEVWFRLCMDRVRSGEAENVTDTILWLRGVRRAGEGKLAWGEGKMLETAANALADEVGLVLGKDPAAIARLIMDAP